MTKGYKTLLLSFVLLELEFIDFGAEEVFEDEDGILIYAPFGSFGAGGEITGTPPTIGL